MVYMVTNYTLFSITLYASCFLEAFPSSSAGEVIHLKPSHNLVIHVTHVNMEYRARFLYNL